MPNTHTPSTVTLPDGSAVSLLVDGDAVNRDNLYKEASPGATKKLTLALLADWVTSLWTNTLVTLSLAAGKHYGLSSRSVTRSAESLFAKTSDSTVHVGAITIPASDAGTSTLDLPHGATLTKCTFTVDPTNATPPAGVSVIGSIYKRNLSTGAVTLIVGTTDPTAGAGYGAAHTFDTATVSEVIDRTLYAYLLEVTGETGSGANSCIWYGTTWTATVTGIDDGVA